MMRQGGNGEPVAQKIQTLLIEDLDGSEAEGTVRFRLDGTEYEIDLNAGHAVQLKHDGRARLRGPFRRAGGGRPALARGAGITRRGWPRLGL